MASKNTKKKSDDKRGAKKKEWSNKPHVVTDENKKTVSKLAGYGISQADIGYILGVSEDTIHRHYKDDFALGIINANAMVANRAFQRCMEGSDSLIKYWLGARAGWKENIPEGPKEAQSFTIKNYVLGNSEQMESETVSDSSMDVSSKRR